MSLSNKEPSKCLCAQVDACSSRSCFIVLYPFRMSHAFRWAYVLLLASLTPFAAVVAAAACVVGIVAVVAAAVMSAWLLVR